MISGNKDLKSENLSLNLLLLLWAAAVVSLCGNDGFLRIEYPRWDSSWFYMGGKAWMEGLIPYVDFSDSKGPLLWLIYGIGYLISPDSFIGVYLLEILVYWATFCLIYRSALMISANRTLALTVAALMPIAYFFPVIHNEMRVEDFCQLLYAFTLYSLLKIAFGEGGLSRYGLYGGISVGCGLMIKYNIGFILATPLLGLMLWMMVKPSKFKGTLTELVTAFVAGCFVAVVPFLIYFLVSGNLGAFINEYFINTLQTIGNVGGVDGVGIPALIKRYLGGMTFRGIYIAGSCLSVMSAFYRRFHLGSAAWIIAAWFVVAFVLSIMMPWDYYLFNLSIFWIFLFAALILRYKGIKVSGVIITGACVLAMLVISSTAVFHNGEYFGVHIAQVQHRTETKFSKFAKSRIENQGKPATIAYANMPDVGLHLQGRLLPGVKYWALQSGASDDMIAEHIHSIMTEMPDFVIVRQLDENTAKELEARGYVAVLRCESTASTKSILEEIIVYEKGQPLKRGTAR